MDSGKRNGNGAMPETDYEKELERLQTDISVLAPDALRPSVDAGRATQYASLLYQRASLTGNLKSLRDVESVIDEVIGAVNHAGDLLFLKANLAFKLHRLDDVATILRHAPSLCETPEGRALRADLDFQSGRYREARQGYEKAIAENRTWDNLARLAHWIFKMGDDAEADRLYEEAEDELTAKQMRSFAWLELQRGLLDLEKHHHAAAHEHYRKAELAYSGYWLVEQHVAALLAAEGHFAKAAERYCRIAERVPKPEIHEAIGKLYQMQRQDEAEPWLKSAETEYLESAEAGEIHYLHHLADFYLHTAPDPQRALYWAELDAKHRANFSTQAVLALALYRNGRAEEAAEQITAALSSGVVDDHIFSTAAQIFRAAGWNDKADRYATRVPESHGGHAHFHMHH
jgi:tetratricopeptide (TPR) repeat protein